MITDEKLAELRALRKTCIRVPRHLQTPYINALEDAAPDLLDGIERLKEAHATEQCLHDQTRAVRDRYRDMAVRLAKELYFAEMRLRQISNEIPLSIDQWAKPDIAALIKEAENG